MAPNGVCLMYYCFTCVKHEYDGVFAACNCPLGRATSPRNYGPTKSHGRESPHEACVCGRRMKYDIVQFTFVPKGLRTHRAPSEACVLASAVTGHHALDLLRFIAPMPTGSARRPRSTTLPSALTEVRDAALPTTRERSCT